LPDYYFSGKYSYINLDPVFFQIKDMDDLMDVLPKKFNRLYNYKNEMIYLLLDNKIWGVDLKMFSFFRFNCEEIINELGLKSIKIINDIEGEICQSFRKIFPTFEKLKRHMIVLCE
jgi:hypothetical protein